MKNDTDSTKDPQAGPADDGFRRQIASTLFDGALILAYSVGHDIGELTDVVAGLAGRGIILVPAVGNSPGFATAFATGDAHRTDQYGTVQVRHRSGGPVATIDRGELTTEQYIDALASVVKDGA